MKIHLIDQNRSGVFPEHSMIDFLGGGIHVDTRMTIPAREALERVSVWREAHYYYSRPPQGLLYVLAPAAPASAFAEAESVYLAPALRLATEPPFPGERPNPDMWAAADLVACPRCGHALVWYEAGFIPGYRVCAGPEHHHYIVHA